MCCEVNNSNNFNWVEIISSTCHLFFLLTCIFNSFSFCAGWCGCTQIICTINKPTVLRLPSEDTLAFSMEATTSQKFKRCCTHTVICITLCNLLLSKVNDQRVYWHSCMFCMYTKIIPWFMYIYYGNTMLLFEVLWSSM